MKKKILVIGASGHAKVVIDAIELEGEFEIHGLIDSFKEAGQMILGYPILGTESILPDLFQKGIQRGIIAIGDNWIRNKMYEKIHNLVPEFEFVSVVHPTAIVSKYAKIGKGTVILAVVKINADATIGDFCILNTNANLGHDSVMNKFSSLAPSATIGGNVCVGAFTAISLGANVNQGIVIGEHTVIGSSAAVISHISHQKIAYGVPAKAIRGREKGEPYLKSISIHTSFRVFAIASKKELEEYKNVVAVINKNNPFYKTELLDTSDMHRHELFYFVLKKDEIPIVVMPFYKRKIIINDLETNYIDVTSPYGYSGPLFSKNKLTDHLLKYFWDSVDDWYKKNNVVSEFIRFSLNENHKEYTGLLVATLQNVRGELVDPEAQWKNFKPKVRNNYRKAKQQDLQIKIYEGEISEDNIVNFYSIYIQTMQRNKAQSKYFHYIDYFRSFITQNPDSRIIAMVFKDEIPISTELILLGADTMYSYLGGTLSEYFYTRPNDFLKIEVMKWAQDKPFRYYVLGGGRQNGDGLYKYKKSFFSSDSDIAYFTGRKIIDPDAYNKLVAASGTELIDPKHIESEFFPLYRVQKPMKDVQN